MALYCYTIPNSLSAYSSKLHTSSSKRGHSLRAFSVPKRNYAHFFYTVLPPRGIGHVQRGSPHGHRTGALSDKGAESVASESTVIIPEKSVSVILLAGGKGKRMGASMPKQYLPLIGQPIALYSFYTFSRMPQVKEIIAVCDASYKDIFEEAGNCVNVNLKFALPGKERQDSVLSGLKEIDQATELACVHDSARPLVSSKDVEKVLGDAWVHGAAVLGVPVKATIKEANNDCFVVKTLNRQTLWEIQTPQIWK